MEIEGSQDGLDIAKLKRHRQSLGRETLNALQHATGMDRDRKRHARAYRAAIPAVREEA